MVPGMQFNPDKPLDPSDPASVPIVTPITPELLRQEAQARERDARADTSYQALLGKPRAYLIGPNDIVSIVVWDHPELISPVATYTIGSSGAVLPAGQQGGQAAPGFVVSADGYIQFPYVGVVKVGGLTEIQTQELLTDRLAKYIRMPQVTVRVMGFFSKRIYVDGEVREPGALPITTVSMSLSEALSEAGGVIDATGDASRITVSRNGTNYPINLPTLIAQGVDPSRIILRSGDVVHVASRENYKVFVSGEVISPHPVPMRNNGHLTLSEALGEANSVQPTSSAPNRILVIRAGKSGDLPQVFQLDAKSPVGLALAENFQLHAKDVVYVDTTGLVRWNRVISLLVPTTTAVYMGQRINASN